MAARILRATDGELPPGELQAAVAALRAGELVALPTETVYGLAVRADRQERLQRIKGSRDTPYAIHLGNADLDSLAVLWTPPARRLAKRYWPGPVLLILPSSEGASIGYRMPASALTRAILDAVGAPVLMSSANRRSEPPINDPARIAQLFGTELAAIVDDGPPPIGQPSTVVHLGPPRLEVRREGIISASEIRAAAGRRVLLVCTGNTCRSPMAAGWLRHLLAARLSCDPRDLDSYGYEISSAGLLAGRGAPASSHAIEAMAEHGIAITGHRSRPVESALLERFDLIFALGSEHQRLLRELHPEIAERVRMLAKHSISDPIGGSLEVYRRCCEEIRSAVEKLADL